MIKINLKQNKGISMVDLIIAMLILSMFIGIIGSLYYQILYYNLEIRMNAIAVQYAVKIAEDIDKMKYDNVQSKENDELRSTYEFSDNFQVNMEVKNYNESDSNKKDIIKIVTINVNYKILNDSKSYEIKKLKIKE